MWKVYRNQSLGNEAIAASFDALAGNASNAPDQHNYRKYERTGSSAITNARFEQSCKRIRSNGC